MIFRPGLGLGQMPLRLTWMNVHTDGFRPAQMAHSEPKLLLPQPHSYIFNTIIVHLTDRLYNSSRDPTMKSSSLYILLLKPNDAALWGLTVWNLIKIFTKCFHDQRNNILLVNTQVWGGMGAWCLASQKAVVIYMFCCNDELEFKLSKAEKCHWAWPLTCLQTTDRQFRVRDGDYLYHDTNKNKTKHKSCWLLPNKTLEVLSIRTEIMRWKYDQIGKC